MLKIVVTVAALAIAGGSTCALAGPCGAQKQAMGKDTSKVDPATTGQTSPGAKAESPGTVGAMKNAQGGSFTANGKSPTGADEKNGGPSKGDC